MWLAFPKNAHQNANQKPIGSAPAYRAQCTLSPQQFTRASFRFFKGLVPRLVMKLKVNLGSVLESELINRNGDMVKLVSSEKNLRFKVFFDRLLQQERKEPA